MRKCTNCGNFILERCETIYPCIGGSQWEAAVQKIFVGEPIPDGWVDVTTSADLSTDPLHLRITPGPEEVS